MNDSLRLAEIASTDAVNRLDAIDDRGTSLSEFGESLVQGRTTLKQAAKHLVKSVVHP